MDAWPSRRKGSRSPARPKAGNRVVIGPASSLGLLDRQRGVAGRPRRSASRFIGIGGDHGVRHPAAFYNAVSRYVVATEVPIVGGAASRRGWKFWIRFPHRLLLRIHLRRMGGQRRQGLFALIVGRVHRPDELEYLGCWRSACSLWFPDHRVGPQDFRELEPSNWSGRLLLRS